MTPSTRSHPGQGARTAWLGYERAVLAHQEILAEDLVRLRVKSMGEIRSEVGRLAALLTVTHPPRARAALASAIGCPACASIARRLVADHERFRASADQLYWFWSIVRADDHGGNRQALGQYWKVVLEALEVHLNEESVLEVHRTGVLQEHWAPSPPDRAPPRRRSGR